MNHQIFGEGEYLLMKEEWQRVSTPCDLGIALNKESGRREPAIVLRQSLKDKENLKFRDVDTAWAVAHNSGNIEMLFLTINFKATDGKHPEQIRIYIDGFTSHLMDWFGLLIDTKGELALSDVTGDVQVIMVTGVPLDVPQAQS
jgi:hypothetical protein